MMKRRQFIEVVGASALASTWSPAFGRWPLREDEGGADRCLLIIELSGGNDGLNTIVPRDDDRYRRARPTLAVPKAQTLKLSDELGLHPRLRALEPAWKKGQIAIVNDVGYPHPDRSHFRSMDIWQSGVPDGVETRSGWIGRSLAARKKEADLDGLFALGGGPSPLLFEGGPRSVTSLSSISDLELRGGKAQKEAVRAGLEPRPGEKSSPALDRIRAASSHALELSRRLQRASAAATKRREAFPGTPFGAQLALVSSLLEGGFRRSIFHVRLGGFDTHARQNESHPILLGVLAEGLAALLRESAKLESAPALTTMVFSEFGRRVRENGSAGTDHGAAGPVLLLSDHIKSGLHGSPPDLADLDEGDLRYQHDFRALGRCLLSDWMQLPSPKNWAKLAAPKLF
jgi:uncharacterized protein (DUF1501 family)